MVGCLTRVVPTCYCTTGSSIHIYITPPCRYSLSLKKYIYSAHKYKDHRAEQQDLNAKPQGCFCPSRANVKAASHNTLYAF